VGRIVSESALTTRINAARTAIGDSGAEQRFIRTLPRKGIRFVGAVREEAEPVAPGVGSATATAVSTGKAAENAPQQIQSAPPAADRGPVARGTSERRQLTVMCCELIKPALLSIQMELEDLRDTIDAYHRCVVDTASRLSGHVAKRIGNVAVVTFGYPSAHEDDADQAVRAGLELCAAVEPLRPKTGGAWQCRVGIATSQVIVSGTTAIGDSLEHNLVGEAANLSARLQALARPGTVVVDRSTRRLIRELFDCRDLGLIEMTGIAEPVHAWQVLKPRNVESRFEALHGGGLTELVGREEELELLLRRWSKAKAGEGQVVLLSGEPGIGKSRLAAALSDRLASEPHTRLRYFCSLQYTDSALYPIINLMERTAGFAHDDSALAKLDKLDALLAQSFTSPQDAAVLAEMLSLPNDGRYPKVELTAQQRRQKTLEALTAQLEALARSNPILIIFEDVHWADPTSLEALGRAVDRLRQSPGC
jgi:class 3 adenylate cyclase